MYTEKALRKGLRTRVFGNKIYTFDTIDSTNNCAKAVAGCGAEEGTVVIAEKQTAGRGRLGRLWQANPNENLTFSIVLRPKLSAEAVNLIPLYVAVGVARAVERVTRISVDCKWPNDLLVNGKKFAGILIEGSFKQNTVESVIVGIGINVNQQSFPPDLQNKATSLRLETNKKIDRRALLSETLASLEELYKTINSNEIQSIIALWLSRSTMINKPISVSQQGNVISGIVKGLSKEGALVLQSNGTEKKLFAGDVTIVGM